MNCNATFTYDTMKKWTHVEVNRAIICLVVLENIKVSQANLLKRFLVILNYDGVGLHHGLWAGYL